MEPYHIQLLKAKYETKKKENPRYTLRMMARLFAIDPGSLSQILKQKRQIPKSEWLNFSQKLKLNEAEKKKFLESLWIEAHLKQSVMEALESYSEVLDDAIYSEIIEEWEFAAALCLLNIIEGRHFHVETLTLNLGLTTERASEIYQKLFQYGLLEKKDGVVYAKTPHFSTSEDTISQALRTAHKKELSLVCEKMESISIDEREITSVTFAGNKEDILLMKEWIRLRRDEFQVKFENKEPDEVYLFCLQLVPLLKKEK